MNELSDWILNKTDNIIKKVTPYWKINEPQNEDLVRKEVEAERQKYGKEYDSKYLKMHYYNNIKSVKDIIQTLESTYQKENNAFKLLFSFGYVTEKNETNWVIDYHTLEESETESYKIKLFYPSQNYFYDEPVCIRNKGDINRLTSEINAENITHKLAQK